jgi:flagellar biosynthesis/type III secretory pathway M-ring protein FliF/YscJ
VTLVSIFSALAVAIYGVETGRNSVAMVGLAFTALVAVVMAVKARTAIRAEIRSREACDRALAKSERAREELRLATERLQRRNGDLQAFQLAVVQGFDLIDERTQGRLTELVEEAGDELAALVDDALDDPTDGAS